MNIIIIISANAECALFSEETREVYGDVKIFKQRTRKIMKQLVDQLPDWLRVIKI